MGKMGKMGDGIHIDKIPPILIHGRQDLKTPPNTVSCESVRRGILSMHDRTMEASPSAVAVGNSKAPFPSAHYRRGGVAYGGTTAQS